MNFIKSHKGLVILLAIILIPILYIGIPIAILFFQTVAYVGEEYPDFTATSFRYTPPGLICDSECPQSFDVEVEKKTDSTIKFTAYYGGNKISSHSPNGELFWSQMYSKSLNKGNFSDTAKDELYKMVNGKDATVTNINMVGNNPDDGVSPPPKVVGIIFADVSSMGRNPANYYWVDSKIYYYNGENFVIVTDLTGQTWQDLLGN